MSFVSFVPSVVTRFAQNCHAAVAPTFGLLLLPILGLTGLSVDVGLMLAEKTRAQNIADAGALDAMRVAQAYMTTNGNSVQVFNRIRQTAQTNSKSFMSSMASSDANMVNAKPSITLAYSSTTNTITATATLAFNYQTAFMGIFGVTSVPVSVPSSSSSSLAKFTQVIFLVDVSGSMGVAATTGDLANLKNMMYSVGGTAMRGCAFACHESAGGPCGPYPCADYRTLARTGGQGGSQIKLKIDYAQAAVQDFTDKMAASAPNAPGHLGAGIYTFSGTLNSVLPVTQDFTAISNAVSAIDLDLYGGDTTTTAYYGGTSLTSVLQQLKSKITNVGKGDGSSPTDQLTYLILVTDGVEDTLASGYPDGHKTDTTWTSACAPIKSMGVNIATVQAQYVSFPQDQTYVDLVQPINYQITPAMTACASSPDLALSASDGPGLETAIDSLFATVVATPRLTN
jgi:Flp pilus assembly protein TadG